MEPYRMVLLLFITAAALPLPLPLLPRPVLASPASPSPTPSLSLCRERVQEWHGRTMEELRADPPPAERPQLKPLLFFLHIPRTGGRTYHQCFLKPIFPPNERCPRSYDTLRLNPENPSCRLLSTHDDFSLMSRLPPQGTSVITNVRDPADRLLSAYEFVVEIAARSLRWQDSLPSKQAQNVGEGSQGRRRMSGREEGEGEGGNSTEKEAMPKRMRTETRSIWPWSYLVPFMEDDLWARRRDQRDGETISDEYFKGPAASYNAPHVIMSLREFADHPLVKDLIYNGGTMQVAGLTNNSRLEGATLLRHCAVAHSDLGDLVLEVAKARLDRMLHVGLTAQHKASARLLAHAIRLPLSSPAQAMRRGEMLRRSPEERREIILERKKGLGLKNFHGRRNRRALEFSPNRDRGSVSLLQHYHTCVTLQRSKYKNRRNHALKSMTGFSLDFSQEQRENLPKEFYEEIRAKNRLDMELLAHAQKIFQKEMEWYGKVLPSEAEEEARIQRADAELEAQRRARDSLSTEQTTERFYVPNNGSTPPSDSPSDKLFHQQQKFQLQEEDRKRWLARMDLHKGRGRKRGKGRGNKCYVESPLLPKFSDYRNLNAHCKV